MDQVDDVDDGAQSAQCLSGCACQGGWLVLVLQGLGTGRDRRTEVSGMARKSRRCDYVGVRKGREENKESKNTR